MPTLADISKIVVREPYIKGKSFVGVVKKNDDTTEKLGRIRVNIPELHGDIADDDLPWVHSTMGPKSGIMYMIPEVDDIVNVVFQEDDIYHGYYTPSSFSTNTKVDDFDEDYPDTYGFLDSQKTKIKINKKTGTLEITHRDKNKLSIDKDGKITIEGGKAHSGSGEQDTDVILDGKFNLTVKKEATITCQDKVDITVTKDVTIDGSQDIIIKSGGIVKVNP
mgnify:CR=1 FL=1